MWVIGIIVQYVKGRIGGKLGIMKTHKDLSQMGTLGGLGALGVEL